jgi:hypothetical protein
MAGMRRTSQSRPAFTLDSGGNEGPAAANVDTATCDPEHSPQSLATILAIPKENSSLVSIAVGPTGPLRSRVPKRRASSLASLAARWRGR